MFPVRLGESTCPWIQVCEDSEAEWQHTAVWEPTGEREGDFIVLRAGEPRLNTLYYKQDHPACSAALDGGSENDKQHW